MERIPEKLQKENLPIAATFISEESTGLQVGLQASQSTQDPYTGIHERVEGSGINVKFRSGRLIVKNKELLQMLMNSESYNRGMFRIDDEDPTGFWRQTGVLEVATVKIPVLDKATHPDFGKVDLKALKAPKEDDEEVKPLRKLASVQ